MPYETIGYINENPPAINRDNLNHMDNGIKAAYNSAENLKKKQETVIYTFTTGLYVNSETGAFQTNDNYSVAKDAGDNNQTKIMIPEGCSKIVFGNAKIPTSGTAGWATYSSQTGYSTDKYIRGGKTNYIDVQDGDVCFGVCSQKVDGQYITEFSVTYYYGECSIDIDEIEKQIDALDDVLDKVTDLCEETNTFSTNQGKYVDYSTGNIGSAANYTIAKDENSNIRIAIPEGCTKIIFNNIVIPASGVSGWATYSSDQGRAVDDYIRGARTNYIDVQDGDRFYAVSSGKNSGAFVNTFDITYIYGKINVVIDELEKSIGGANKINNEGMKVVMLGDSIVGNYDGVGSIAYYLSNYTKAECYNCAFGGSSMGSDLDHPHPNLEAFNGWKIIQAITTNNYTVQQTAIDNDPTYQELKSYFQAHLDILKNMDWSTVDIITLSYGTNDWGTRVILDDETNPMSTDTFGGAYRTAIETLWNTYPHIKIMANGVIWRGTSIEGGEVIENTDDSKCGRAYYLKEFEDKAKEICEKYHVLFTPIYDYVGLNKWTWKQYFPSNDATHPNEKGRNIIAKRYAANMIQLSKN